MSVLSEISEVIGEKDDALAEVIYWFRQHSEKCDAAGASNNCDGTHHWFLCEEEVKPLVDQMVKAFKAR